MRLNHLSKYIQKRLKPFIDRIESAAKAWAKPPAETLTGGMMGDLVRSRRDLVAENAVLRQQLIILYRQTKQPKLIAWDRGLLVALASRFQRWRHALLIVKPDTLLRWHREGFKLFWRRKSRSTCRKPRLPETTITLIQQMATENPR